MKSELEMADDPISTALRTEERVHFIDFSDHLGPAFGGHMLLRIFNDWHMKGIGSGLALLLPQL